MSSIAAKTQTCIDFEKISVISMQNTSVKEAILYDILLCDNEQKEVLRFWFDVRLQWVEMHLQTVSKRSEISIFRSRTCDPTPKSF